MQSTISQEITHDVVTFAHALVDIGYKVTDLWLAQHDFVKAGHHVIAADRLVTLKQQLHNDNISAVYQLPGGSASNSLVVLQQLARKSALLAAVGDDEVGDFYCDYLTKHNIAHNISRLTASTSGQCLVFITPDGERTLVMTAGCCDELSWHDNYIFLLQQARYLWVEGYAITTPNLANIIKNVIAHSQHKKTILSLANQQVVIKKRKYLLQLINNQVTMLFANKQEAQALTCTDNVTDMVQQLKKLAIKRGAITLGKDGAWLWEDDVWQYMESVPVVCRDAVGAGDVFAGACLAFFLQGKSWWQAGELANQLAAVSVTNLGAGVKQQQIASMLR